MYISKWLLFSANSAISWREQVNFQSDDDDVRFILDQHADLDFDSVNSRNNSPRIDMSSTRTYYFYSESTSLCSFSSMLRA